MINNTIISLDEMISQIKEKDIKESFSPMGIMKFELEFILVLEIVRYELMVSGKISDETGMYLSFAFTFPVFEFYYRDYPNIYARCQVLYKGLQNYNRKLQNDELKMMGNDINIRIKFLKKAVQRLLEKWEI